MPNINKKTYNLTVRTSKSFNIIIDGFIAAATLLFRIRDKIVITFIPSFISFNNLSLNMKRVRIIISPVKLIQKVTQTISLKTIKMIYIMKMSMKTTVIIYVRSPITFVSKLRGKIFTVISAGKVRMLATMVMGQIFPLSIYDPQTLGTLDTATLGSMDYILS